MRTLVPAVVLAMGSFAACKGQTDPGVTTDDTDPVVASCETEGLRPGVQDGVVANADGQEPAFEGQTRAPQPAEATAFRTEVVARGLGVPWGIAPLPDGALLVTERSGRLRRIATDGSVGDPISVVPTVYAQGQGGLLDVVADPDFAANRRIYMTFSESRGNGQAAAAVARAVLSEDGSSLSELTTIYQQQPAWPGGRHFGSRLVFAADGTLFATFGDRGSAFDEAQDPTSAIGAVIRIDTDGGVPSDNPFADGGEGSPEIWSWGHRNIQAATLGADGALWTVEHGPQGGDELNRPEAGVNHGWPVITYGEDYGGGDVGDGITEAEGMAQPVYFWDPVIAPSGMATYSGTLFPDWEGDLLIGGLRAQGLVRLTVAGSEVCSEEWLPLGVRTRSVAMAADGAVLVGTDAGEILRIVPEASQ